MPQKSYWDGPLYECQTRYTPKCSWCIEFWNIPPETPEDGSSYCKECRQQRQKARSIKKYHPERDWLDIAVNEDVLPRRSSLPPDELKDQWAAKMNATSTKRGRPGHNNLCPRCDYVRPRLRGQPYCGPCGKDYRDLRYKTQKATGTTPHEVRKTGLAKMEEELERLRALVQKSPMEEMIDGLMAEDEEQKGLKIDPTSPS